MRRQVLLWLKMHAKGFDQGGSLGCRDVDSPPACNVSRHTHQRLRASPQQPCSAFLPPRPYSHVPQMDGMQAGYNARAQHERRLAAGRAGGTSFGGAESDGTYRTGSADGSPLARLPPLSRRDFLFMSAVGDLDPLVEGLSAADGGAAGERGGGAAAVCRHALWVAAVGRHSWLPHQYAFPPCCTAPTLPASDSVPVVPALTAAAEARWAQLSPHQLAAELHTAGRCSAVVKVTPDFSNLLMGHSAW